MRDTERIDRIRQQLEENLLDAVVCALPAYVLLLSGYWPVVGASVAVATRDGRIVLIVPEDERELAKHGWADEVRTFKPGALDEIRPVTQALLRPLREVGRDLQLQSAQVGYEFGPASEPASYVGMYLYGAAMLELLRASLPFATMLPADKMLENLAAVKTPSELERIRTACSISKRAFQAGVRQLRSGLKETEVAASFQTPLSVLGTAERGVARAGGFAFCMSGANSAEASGAYARSRDKKIASGELVLLHCNSYVDGYWTDVTRTYCLGIPDQRQLGMYEAVLAARKAALEVIRPEVDASRVDWAAREELKARGFDKEFKHSTGHGVGFVAIYHNARPRIHPKSDELLQPGMVFNVEPAVYIEGYAGLRHCDMVAVTRSGVEVLTDFQTGIDELVLEALDLAA